MSGEVKKGQVHSGEVNLGQIKLIHGWCLVGVYRVSGGCLEGIWNVFERSSYVVNKALVI